MEFQPHPSIELVDLFKKKPFQGQTPEKAKIVFLSSDANYSPEISSHSFFNYIFEYHNDGIAFWHKYGCHHPFLLEDYPFNKTQAGVPFHRNFSKLGLTKEYAEDISFLEILDLPTIGNKSKDTKQFFRLLSLSHLARIDNLILKNQDILFFVPGGVLRDMVKISKQFQVFNWLQFTPSLSRLFCDVVSGNRIQQIYHFSSAQIHKIFPDIKRDIDSWLSK